MLEGRFGLEASPLATNDVAAIDEDQTDLKSLSDMHQGADTIAMQPFDNPMKFIAFIESIFTYHNLFPQGFGLPLSLLLQVACQTWGH